MRKIRINSLDFMLWRLCRKNFTKKFFYVKNFLQLRSRFLVS